MKILGFVCFHFENFGVCVLSKERLWTFIVCKKKTTQFVSMQKEGYLVFVQEEDYCVYVFVRGRLLSLCVCKRKTIEFVCFFQLKTVECVCL